MNDRRASLTSGDRSIHLFESGGQEDMAIIDASDLEESFGKGNETQTY